MKSEDQKISERVTLLLYKEKNAEKELLHKWLIEPQKKYSLGRKKNQVDISIKEVEGISRVHAELIYFSPEKIMVKDLSSSNGTFINKTQIKPQEEIFFTIKDILNFGNLDNSLIFRLESNNNNIFSENQENKIEEPKNNFQSVSLPNYEALRYQNQNTNTKNDKYDKYESKSENNFHRKKVKEIVGFSKMGGGSYQETEI